jgi:hypothetical protein
MEYRINKIEMDVRQKINEERSMDKIHAKKGIQVNKDKDLVKENLEENYKNKKNAKDSNTDDENKNDKILRDPDVEHKGEDPDRGHFIDIKR